MGSGDSPSPWEQPRPDIEILCSKGKLTKKKKFDLRRSLPLNSSPSTPIKSVKSKFVVPVNVTPFPLSPQLIGEETPKVEISTGKSAIYGVNRVSSRQNTNSSPLGPKQKEFVEDLVGSDGEISEDSIDEYFFESISSESSLFTCPWKCHCVNPLDLNYFLHSYPKFVCCNPNHDTSIDYLHDNFDVLECIGKGSFSSVFKVSSKTDKCAYALKINNAPFSGYADRYIFEV